VTARLFEVPQVDDRVRLSRREVQILSEAADALSNRQIAHRLGVTEGTVKRHLHNIFTKLAASSRIDAVNKARAAGLLRISHDDAPVT
jgi:ATP/maltotriose-dependent transcriptional regulator MalT